MNWETDLGISQRIQKQHKEIETMHEIRKDTGDQNDQVQYLIEILGINNKDNREKQYLN